MNPTSAARRIRVIVALSALALPTLAACSEEPRALGPADGHDLSPADTGRVAVGDLAPDFTLLSRTGERVTLSDLYHDRDIILVFYRGRW